MVILHTIYIHNYRIGKQVLNLTLCIHSSIVYMCIDIINIKTCLFENYNYCYATFLCRVGNQILKAGNQSFILKTTTGQQIQLNSQGLQLLQQQHQMSGNSAISQLLESTQQTTAQQTVIGRSVTPVATSISLPYNSPQVTQQTLSQLKCASPAPNVNLVHLPPNIQQQNPAPQQQQFQIAPGTILQLPSGGGGVSQALTNAALLQNQVPCQTQVFGSTHQHTNLVNTNNTVIQHPNIVNVNMAPQQQVVPPQRNNLGINIQGNFLLTPVSF